MVFSSLVYFVVNALHGANFGAYLLPKQQAELEEAVKVLAYGGREAYEHRNQLYKRLKERKGLDVNDGDLGLPAWPRLIHLVRRFLDSPKNVSRVPLILREVAFSYLRGSTNRAFAERLCAASPQAGRFAVLTIDYFARSIPIAVILFIARGASFIR